MSRRMHFWLRLAGITLILATEFGPRLWSSQAQGPVSVATALGAR